MKRYFLSLVILITTSIRPALIETTPIGNDPTISIETTPEGFRNDSMFNTPEMSKKSLSPFAQLKNWGNNISDLTAEIVTAGKAKLTTLQQKVDTTLDNIVDQAKLIKDDLKATDSNMLDKLVTTAKQTGDAIKTATEPTITTLKNKLSNTGEKLANHLDTISSKVQQEAAEKLAALNKKIDTAVLQIGGEKALQTKEELGTKLSEFGDSVSHQVKKLQDLGREKIGTTLDTLSDKLKTVSDNLKKSSTKKEQESIKKELIAINRTLKNNAQQLHEMALKAAQKTRERINNRRKQRAETQKNMRTQRTSRGRQKAV
jgi:hypothetical protein